MGEPQKDYPDDVSFKGFTNFGCTFFPCHSLADCKNVSEENKKKEFNCLFCYCPLAWLECPGPYLVFEDSFGVKRKDCTYCTLPHDGIVQSWKFIQKWLDDPETWKGE